nr:MAG TPA: hypothetical protein [Caudoviricetes sp.]
MRYRYGLYANQTYKGCALQGVQSCGMRLTVKRFIGKHIKASRLFPLSPNIR